MAITLSLIIPAYNEAQRLPPYLAAVREHLEKRYPGAHEVIVVDDGSDDGLADLLASRQPEWPELVVMRHPANRGKGAAVRTGMLAARGQLLLFADADGATPIEEEIKLSETIAAGADLAVGSRTVVQADVTRRRTLIRSLVGRLFSGVARWWLGISTRDTQCGFKMFRREAAQKLFAAGEESGYLFDLELFVLARRFEYEVVEVPIHWADVPGSHLGLASQLRKVPVELWRLRRRLNPNVAKNP